MPCKKRGPDKRNGLNKGALAPLTLSNQFLKQKWLG